MTRGMPTHAFSEREEKEANMRIPAKSMIVILSIFTTGFVAWSNFLWMRLSG